MSGPRVLFFIDSLSSGGAQRQLVLVFNELRARGVDAWITYYYAKHHFLAMIPAADRDRVTCLDAPDGAHPLSVVSTVRAHLLSLRPDVVCSLLRGASAIIGMCRLSGLTFRWIASERASLAEDQSVARRSMYLATARFADLVAPNASTTVTEFEGLGFPKRRLAWLPNGTLTTDEMLATPPTPVVSPLRLLSVGTLEARKQTLPLIEALGHLTDRDWVLDHIGRNEHDMDYRRQVDAAVERLGLAERVRLHGPQLDVGPWYAQANVLLHPSLVEGFPNVLLEAWVYATPVVVSDRGEMPVLTQHGLNGYVCDPTDTQAFVATLARVLDHPDDLAPMGEAGRAMVVDEYTMEAAGDRWLEAIDDVIDAPGLKRRLLSRTRGR